MFILTGEQVEYCEAISKSGITKEKDVISGLAYNSGFFVKVKHYEVSEYNEAIKDCRENFLDNVEKQVATLLIKEDTSISIWVQDSRYQPKSTISRVNHTSHTKRTSKASIATEKIIAKMRSKDGLSIKTRRYKLKLYHHCFVGTEAVDWMVKNLKISRDKAVKFGQQLVRAKVIHHVNDDHNFEDSDYFYRFYQDEEKKIWNDKIV